MLKKKKTFFAVKCGTNRKYSLAYIQLLEETTYSTKVGKILQGYNMQFQTKENHPLQQPHLIIMKALYIEKTK